MAFWITNRRDISDDNRTRGGGEIISYEADTMADLNSLPMPNGQNQGSSCFILQNSTVHKLGTIPTAGINGWVQI